MRKTVLLVGLIAFVFWFPIAFKRWTHAFRLSKCFVEWPQTPEWEIEPFSQEKKKELQEILSQPFSYLGKGAQSYVFESKDDQYVLKLFRYDLCRFPFGQRIVRQLRKWVGAREKHFLSAEEKIVKNFTSCKLAYSLAQKQTALVYVHLNPKKCDLPVLTLTDRLHFSHKVDPALYRFALQKKAKSFLKTFLAQPDNIAPLIESYSTLLRELASVGLVNLDPTMGRNFGFLDDRAIQIDFGNFIYCPQKAGSEISHFETQLQTWIKKRLP